MPCIGRRRTRETAHCLAETDYKRQKCESIHCLAEADEEDQQDDQQEAVEAPVKTQYHVWIHTSSCRGAGTEGRVSIELHGQGGSSGLQPLQAANDDAFARSQVTRVINQSVLTFDQFLTFVFWDSSGESTDNNWEGMFVYEV